MHITRNLLTLILAVMLLTGCAKEAAVQKKPLTEMEKFMVNTGLKDIQWISVGWRVEKNENSLYSSSWENKVLASDENSQLVSEIVKAISMGTYQEKVIDPPLEQTDIKIRLSGGKIVTAYFDGKQIIFPAPRPGMDGISGDKGIVINPGKDFPGIIDNIKSGKIKISQKNRTQPEIRNQRVFINYLQPTLIYTYTEDPAFKNFDDTKIDNYKKYNKALIETAQKKGIKPEKVRQAISLLEQDKNRVKIPVILETGRYQGKNALVLVYKWEYKGVLEEMHLGLGHIVVYIVDEETNQLLKTDSCG